jgi:predicted 3-demethylubiquinone-9 3-methyltransferase (glyoxalase superfamily)
MSWQIIPSMLSTWMKNPVKLQRLMRAIHTMRKLDIKELKKAYDSKS